MEANRTMESTFVFVSKVRQMTAGGADGSDLVSGEEAARLGAIGLHD
jgi:hypothetical protein